VKKWIIIVLALAGVWLVVFAILNHRQSPREFQPYRGQALSKTSRRILEMSDEFILLSIDPNPPQMPEMTDLNSKEKFHDYPVLGSVQIKDPKQKGELLAALYKGVRKFHGGVPGCFEPRHGIRAVSGTNWVELVICFECDQVVEYGPAGEGWTLMDKSPRDTFNRALRDAGVPLAK